MTLYRLLAAFVLSLVSIPAAAQTIAQAAPIAQVVASATSPSGISWIPRGSCTGSSATMAGMRLMGRSWRGWPWVWRQGSAKGM